MEETSAVAEEEENEGTAEQEDDGCVYQSEHIDDWECPHDPFESYNRCIFHLDTDKKDNEDTCEAFIEKLKKGGDSKRDYQFIGASFQELNLEDLHLGGQNNRPIDLRFSKIKGDFICSGAIIYNRFILSGLVVCGDAIFRRTKFKDHVIFGKYYRQGNKRNTVFKHNTDFYAAEFEYASFSGAEFNLNVNFERATFRYVRFDESIFGADPTASINNDSNEKEQSQRNSDVRTNFKHATIAKSSFRGSVFNNYVSFFRAEFRSDADFSAIDSERTTTFRQGVSFHKADFQGDTTFNNAEVDTQDTEPPNQIVNFSYAKFERVFFKGVKFRSDVTFSFSLFKDLVSFSSKGDTDTVFNGNADFYWTQFDGSVVFQNTKFYSGVNFQKSAFDRKTVFKNVQFDGSSGDQDKDKGDNNQNIIFSECRFSYVLFYGCEFSQATSFTRAVFQDMVRFTEDIFSKKILKFTAPVTFREAIFQGPVSFSGTIFDKKVKFTRVIFEQSAYFDHLTISNLSKELETSEDKEPVTAEKRDGTTFNAEVDFSEAKFYQGATFESSKFAECAPNFQNVDFLQEVSFDNSYFGGNDKQPVCFSNCKFNFASFCGVEFDCVVDFSEAIFRDRVQFHELDESHRTIFEGDVNFDKIVTQGEARFDSVTFKRNVYFRRAIFEGATYFDDVTSKGVAHTSTGTEFRRLADYSGATFGSEVRFDNSSFELYPPVFSEVDFKQTLEFTPKVVNPYKSEYVDFSQSNVNAGQIKMPTYEHETDMGNSENQTLIFDFTEATLGNISLTGNDEIEENFLDHFKFNRTRFEEFKFSDYQYYFGRSKWKIHPTVRERHSLTSGKLFPGFRHRIKILNDDDSGNYFSNLEQTYLRAKNGANAVGDNKAAGEFFRKERIYRRWVHLHLFLYPRRRTSEDLIDRIIVYITDILWRRAKVLYKTIANTALGLVSGYGERPFRVVFVSSIIIVCTTLLLLLYAGWRGRTVGLGQFDELLLASFRAFIFDSPYMSSDPAVSSNPRAVASLPKTEEILEWVGFLGKFLFGLWVMTLYRKIAR